MFKFVVQFLFLLILLLRNRKAKGGWLTPSGVLIMIYAVCSLMGIIVVWSGEYRSPLRSYYWMPMLVFDLFILLYLLPFRRFNEMRINMLRLPSRQFLDIFSTIIIILSFYAIIYYASTVRFIFSLGDLGAARDIRYLEGEFVETGLFNTIASVSSANYVFAIVLYFIYKAFGNSKTRCRLLFISSFSNAIHVLSFVGRDGIVFWLFTFVFCWAFFSPYLQIDTRKKIRKIFTIGGAILFIPIFIKSITLKDIEYIAIGLYNGFKLWNKEGNRLLFQISNPTLNKRKTYAFTCCSEFSSKTENDINVANCILSADNYGQLFLIWANHLYKGLYFLDFTQNR